MSTTGQAAGPAGDATHRIEYVDETGASVSAPRPGSVRVAGTGGSEFFVAGTGWAAAPQGGGLAGLLAPMWRTGMAGGILGLVLGCAMIALTNGLAAVIFWPIGTFSMVVGATVLWATIGARRAMRELDRAMTAAGNAQSR